MLASNSQRSACLYSQLSAGSKGSNYHISMRLCLMVFEGHFCVLGLFYSLQGQPHLIATNTEQMTFLQKVPSESLEILPSKGNLSVCCLIASDWL